MAGQKQSSPALSVSEEGLRMLWHVMCTILSHRGGGGDGPRLECLLTLQDQHIGTQDRCQEELKYTITENHGKMQSGSAWRDLVSVPGKVDFETGRRKLTEVQSSPFQAELNSAQRP